MLSYLLDENISPAVAEQIQAKNTHIPIRSVRDWQGGALVGKADSRVLRTARQEGLTLVTYDLKTIPDLLAELAAENESHAGVLFVGNLTIRSNDFGGLVRALLVHWQTYHTDDWTNRIAFLNPSPAT
jgi:hypothetical protein